MSHHTAAGIKLGSYVLSDDLELGKDEVRAKRKGRQEGSEAKVPNDHERCVYSPTSWCVFVPHEVKTIMMIMSMETPIRILMDVSWFESPRDLIEMVEVAKEG